tara:strand:- start:230 stop:532 length:303 start_codon:yes stop_codon:yes gene_type:complete
MKASIKLKEITKLSLGTDLALITLTLETENLSKTIFTLTSTGMSLRLSSEHSTIELMNFCDWLSKESKDESNLRDNESELRIFAKDMIKTNKKLSQDKKL